MNRFFSRITATFLFIGAIIGLVLSLAAIVLVFPIRTRLEAGLGDILSLSHNGLTTTSDVLDVMDETLTSVDGSLILLVDSTRNAAEKLQTTSDMATSIAGVVGDGFLNVITETQSSLDAASNTARLVDDTLAFISAIPYIGARYAPENTLEDTIQGISTSLDPMSTNLGNIRDDLNNTAKDIGGIQSSLVSLADNLDGMVTSIEKAQTSTQEYMETVDKLIEKVEFAQKNYRTWLTIAAVLMVAFFLWTAAAQIGLIMQAKLMWAANFNAPVKVLPEPREKTSEKKEVEFVEENPDQS